jgi:Flp pilus assembly protein TadG
MKSPAPFCRQCWSGYRRARGTVLVYAAIAMGCVMVMLALAMAYGELSTAKSELQAATDAGALYALSGISNSTVTSRAQAAAAQNRANGAAVTVSAGNVTSGRWDPNARTFTAAGTPTNAVRVTASASVPLTFGGYLGVSARTMQATSIAALNATAELTFTVGALSSPWTAGLAPGWYDPYSVPTNQPYQVTGFPLTPGEKIQFFNCTGEIYVPGWGTYPVEGKPEDGVYNVARNGIAGLYGPGHAIIGVFLDNNVPTATAAPANFMDFTVSANRNLSTYAPALKQVFFIGDGMTDAGVRQEWVIPAGATRLFIGNLDDHWFYGDNTGQFQGGSTGRVRAMIVK